MPVDAKYTTAATASGGGRAGHTALTDGSMKFDLIVPKELGGPGGEGTNPEKLFALGYSACFLGALYVGAKQIGVEVPPDATVTATIGIGRRSEGGFGITAGLDVFLPRMDEEKAERLVEITHGICPYSNAIESNVAVAFTIQT